MNYVIFILNSIINSNQIINSNSSVFVSIDNHTIINKAVYNTKAPRISD